MSEYFIDNLNLVPGNEGYNLSGDKVRGIMSKVLLRHLVSGRGRRDLFHVVLAPVGMS